MESHTKEFLKANDDQLTPDYNPDLRHCEVFTTCDSSLQHLGEEIKLGNLVSFPTETVYGLGADATNETAIRSIYKAKGRPLTDPVIVHINRMEMIENIADQQKTDLE